MPQMLNSFEDTFLKHLDSICNKYKDVNEEGDDGIDLSLVKEPRKIKFRVEPRFLYSASPPAFSFMKRRRKGDTGTKRFAFYDARERFHRLYKVFYEELIFDDLAWMNECFFRM